MRWQDGPTSSSALHCRYQQFVCSNTSSLCHDAPMPVRSICTYLTYKSLSGLMLQYQCDLKQFHFPCLINLPAPKCNNLSRCKKTYFPEGPFNCWELHCFCSVGEILIGSGCSGCFHTRAREPLYPHHQLLLLLHQKCTSSHWLYCLSRQQRQYEICALRLHLH